MREVRGSGSTAGSDISQRTGFLAEPPHCHHNYNWVLTQLADKVGAMLCGARCSLDSNAVLTHDGRRSDPAQGKARSKRRLAATQDNEDLQ